jgi:hypothetical protein
MRNIHSLRGAYDPRNWFWKVANREGVYSSAAAGYIGEADERYTKFIGQGYRATNIPTDGELSGVLAMAGLPATTIEAAGHTSWGTLPPAGQARVMRAIGCRVESKKWPTLAGLYSVTADDINRLSLVASSATLPAGFAVPDIQGMPHPADKDAVIGLSAALSTYAQFLAAAESMALAGISVAWPAQPVEV